MMEQFGERLEVKEGDHVTLGFQLIGDVVQDSLAEVEIKSEVPRRGRVWSYRSECDFIVKMKVKDGEREGEMMGPLQGQERPLGREQKSDRGRGLGARD